MTTYARKPWTIVAYTWQGSAYCLDCAARGLMNLEVTRETNTDQPHPVFLSDDFYLIDPETGKHTPNTCDTCQNPIQQ